MVTRKILMRPCITRGTNYFLSKKNAKLSHEMSAFLREKYLKRQSLRWGEFLSFETSKSCWLKIVFMTPVRSQWLCLFSQTEWDSWQWSTTYVLLWHDRWLLKYHVGHDYHLDNQSNLLLDDWESFNAFIDSLTLLLRICKARSRCWLIRAT